MTAKSNNQKRTEKDILWFEEISIKDVPLVGGKNASLGEMYSKLTPKGVSVPNGFALTSTAYWKFLKNTGLEKEIKNLYRFFLISGSSKCQFYVSLYYTPKSLKSQGKLTL